MAKQTAGAPIPAQPDSPRNAEGNPTGNPSGGGPETVTPAPLVDGYPVSPAVARVRSGPQAAHGQGSAK